MSCLYILEITPLWVVSFAIIFSHSEGCRITLFIVCWVKVCKFDLVVFLGLSCMSCLCILVINHLSVVSFAIIFSHSEHCLFTLLIVSFVVQKLLSFIRSHLFIFAFISNILGGGS